MKKPSMGLVYLPLYIYIFVVDFDGKLVGKYTSPMDPMGGWLVAEKKTRWESSGGAQHQLDGQSDK